MTVCDTVPVVDVVEGVVGACVVVVGAGVDEEVGAGLAVDEGAAPSLLHQMAQ